MNEVTFTYQRTKEDIFKHAVWHRMIKNKLFMALNLVFPLFGIYALVTSFQLETTNTIQYVAIVYLMLYPVFTYFFIKYRVNQIFKNPDVKVDTTTFTINTAGVNVSSEQGAHLLPWENVFQVYETKGYFYIYIDKTNSLLVNKENLGEGNTAALKEIFKNNLTSIQIKFK